jgi:hypothetical protein
LVERFVANNLVLIGPGQSDVELGQIRRKLIQA